MGKGRCLANIGLNWIANYIRGIADDVLHDFYVWGEVKGRDSADDRVQVSGRCAGEQQKGDNHQME